MRTTKVLSHPSPRLFIAVINTNDDASTARAWSHYNGTPGIVDRKD